MRIGAFMVLLGLSGCWGDLDADGFAADEDCDDEDDRVHPRAVEVGFDGLDNDCDPNSLDACEIRQPCTRQDCSFVYDFERFDVGGSLTYQGLPLPASEQPVAELIFTSEAGHRATVDLYGGEAAWSTRLPAGRWSAALRLLDDSVPDYTTCVLPLLDGEEAVDLASDLRLALEAASFLVTGEVTYRGREIAEEGTGTVEIGSCDPVPVGQDGQFAVRVGSGEQAVRVALDGQTLPQGWRELPSLHVEGDAVRDIDLQGLSVSGSVEVGGVPAGARVSVRLGSSIQADISAGRYVAEIYPGTWDFNVLVSQDTEGGGSVSARHTVERRTLKKDATVELRAEMDRLQLVGDLLSDEEALELLFLSARSRAEVSLAPGERSVSLFRARYRLMAGRDLDQAAEGRVLRAEVDEDAIERLDRLPMRVYGEVRVDGEPVDDDAEARLRLRDRRLGDRWSPQLETVPDYAVEVTPGMYDITVEGLEARASGRAVAARARWLNGQTAKVDLDLATHLVELDLNIDGQPAEAEAELAELTSTVRRLPGGAPGLARVAAIEVPIRDGRGSERMFAGGVYRATAAFREGDTLTELALEPCLFIGDGPPGALPRRGEDDP